MKINTRKVLRIIQAQNSINRRLGILNRNAWDNRNKIEKLEKEDLAYENKLQSLYPLISEDEFDNHLASTMCCEYSDINNQ
jgi:hypothetical protein